MEGEGTREWLGASVPGTRTQYEQAVAPGRLPSYRRRMGRLRRLKGTGGHLLDIGAATGDFMAVAARSGWEAEGVEVSAYACRRAHWQYGLTLFNGELKEYCQTEKGTFDVVHMAHVLEHFTAPDRALVMVRSLLEYNGIVVIEVPNQFEAWVNRLRYAVAQPFFSRRRKPDVHSIHHTYFFEPHHIEALLSQQGFRVIDKQTFFFRSD